MKAIFIFLIILTLKSFIIAPPLDPCIMATSGCSGDDCEANCINAGCEWKDGACSKNEKNCGNNCLVENSCVNDGECVACKEGFGRPDPESSQSCDIQCGDGCKECTSLTGPENCLNCKKGWIHKDNSCIEAEEGDSCTTGNAIIEGCKACDSNDKLLCSECEEGYLLTRDKTSCVLLDCKKTIDNCKECQSEDVCKTCENGYTLDSSSRSCSLSGNDSGNQTDLSGSTFENSGSESDDDEDSAGYLVKITSLAILLFMF